MKVYNFEDLIADIPLNLKCIDLNEIIDSYNGTMLLYRNRKFQTAIKSLIDDMVKESASLWEIPDYEKSRVYFYITSIEIYLSIEVFPKRFSAQEKQTMLQTASQEEMVDGWSEHLKLMGMFDNIDEILNCSYPVGEVGTYFLELSNDEKEALFSLIKVKQIIC